MRPTDFCFPSLCQRAPAPRLLPIYEPVLPDCIRREGCFTAPFSLRWAARLVSTWGRFLPRAEALDRTSDTPVALRASTWCPRLIASARRHAPGRPRPILPPSPWRDDGALDPRCLPSTSTRALHPDAQQLSADAELWLVLSPIPRLCKPRPGSRRFFARGDPRFSLARLAKIHRLLDPVHVNWPFG